MRSRAPVVILLAAPITRVWWTAVGMVLCPPARSAVRLGADASRAGGATLLEAPVGSHDSWIAATAMAHGIAVVTSNLRDFSCIRGLSVIAARR